MYQYVLRNPNGKYVCTDIGKTKITCPSKFITDATLFSVSELKKFARCNPLGFQSREPYALIDAHTLGSVSFTDIIPDDVLHPKPLVITPDPDTLPVIIGDKLADAIRQIVYNKINEMKEEGLI